MKRAGLKTIVFILPILAVMLFSGCFEPSENKTKTCRIVLEESSYYTVEEHVKEVERGSDAVFALKFRDGYTFGKASYDEDKYDISVSSPNVNGVREAKITLHNVRYPVFLSIEVREVERLHPVENAAVISYSLNGGNWIDKQREGEYYTVYYPLEHYPRPNTSIGTDVIEREGYTLIGWNTEADGGGEHIGLGSRVTVLKNESAVLYAEWAEHTEAAQLNYVVVNTDDLDTVREEKDKKKALSDAVQRIDLSRPVSAVITKYDGDGQTLVIPSEIDGYTVRAVAPSAAENNANLRTVILPETVYYVMSRAFSGCDGLNEIYLFDSLNYIDPDAFGARNTVQTMHINAVLPPIYGYKDPHGYNESAQLANKLEMLVMNENRQKTVIFGSCSAWYGIHAKTFGEATGRLTFNMGVEGVVCATFQLDLIKQYMHAGDTLIYICDVGSPFLMLYDLRFASLSYQFVEFNYDLLASVDLTRYENVIPALNEYLIDKHNSFYVGSYNDYIDYISEYGDMDKPREGSSFLDFYATVSPEEMLENNMFDKTKAVFDEFVSMGIDIYYGFGNICESTVSVDYINEVNALFYEQFEKKNVPAKIIAPLNTARLSPPFFYDWPYRLNTVGSRYYTEFFIERFLQAAPKTQRSVAAIRGGTL